MGYRKEPTHYRLKFEDMEGLEVVAKALPLKDFLEINRLSVEIGEHPEKASEQSVMMFRKFADALVSWNLEDEHGKPVSSNYKGLETLEIPFVLDLVRAWMDAMASVPKRSPGVSNGTGTYPERSLPMAVS